MNEFILANLLFQAGATTVLMLVAGISAAHQLHVRRVARLAAQAEMQVRSEAA